MWLLASLDNHSSTWQHHCHIRCTGKSYSKLKKIDATEGYYTYFQVAAHSLDTGIRGAYYNVCINLKQVKDEDFVSSISQEAEKMVQESTDNLSKVLDIAKNRH